MIDPATSLVELAATLPDDCCIIFLKGWRWRCEGKLQQCRNCQTLLEEKVDHCRIRFLAAASKAPVYSDTKGWKFVFSSTASGSFFFFFSPSSPLHNDV